MKLLPCSLVVLTLGSVLPAWSEDSSPAERKPAPIPDGYVLYVTQPNGWGDTRAAAIKDLHNRIFPWYKRNFGDRPGFKIDWNWVAMVEVADGREWQADGRVQWYVPRSREASSGPKRSRHSHLRSK